MPTPVMAYECEACLRLHTTEMGAVGCDHCDATGPREVEALLCGVCGLIFPAASTGVCCEGG